MYGYVHPLSFIAFSRCTVVERRTSNPAIGCSSRFNTRSEEERVPIPGGNCEVV